MRGPVGRKSLYFLASFIAVACSETTQPDVSRMMQLEGSVASVSGLTGRIVYVNKGLRVFNLATLADVSLSTSGVNPEFSPDGSLIAYQNNGLRVMNADGGNVRLLRSTGGTPTFDPTGTMIAFKDNGIWKINVDGTGLIRLLAGDAHWPAWSPDGAQIAYGAPVGSAIQLFIMNADGTNRRQVLTSGPIIDVAWRPSNRLLFGMSNGKRSTYELYSFDPTDASNLTRLTTSTVTDFEPSWSPDGTQIAWVSGTSGPSSGIWVMNADGSIKQGPVIPKGRQGSWGR